MEITDVNDNLPKFELQLYKMNVIEDIGVGATIGKVTAADKDTGNNGLISYKMLQADIGKTIIQIDEIYVLSRFARRCSETEINFLLK